MSWLSRIANVFRSSAVDRGLDDEMAFHIESRIADLVAGGMTRDAAEAVARRQFGSRLRLREQSRDVKLLPWFDSLVRDVRLGVRMLRKNGLVTAAAIVSLSLALGACVAAFSLVDALILRPLPVHQPERLIYLTFPGTNPDAPEERHVQRSGVRAPARRRPRAGRPVRDGVSRQAPRDIRRGGWRAGDGALAVRLR